MRYRVEFEKWQQHKGAQVHAWVRHDKAGSVDAQVVHQKDVEIHGARSIPVRADPPERYLDRKNASRSCCGSSRLSKTSAAFT